MGDAAHRQLPLRDRRTGRARSRRRCTPTSTSRARSTTGCASSASRSAPRPDDLVPFEKYAARRRGSRGRPRRRARFSPARRTSSGSTGWCRRSRPRRASATRSSTRPSRSSTTASRKPQGGRLTAEGHLSRLSPLAAPLPRSSPRAGRCPDPGLRCVAGVRESAVERASANSIRRFPGRMQRKRNATRDPAQSYREAAHSFAEAFGRRGAWGEVIRPRDRKAGQAPPAMA